MITPRYLWPSKYFLNTHFHLASFIGLPLWLAFLASLSSKTEYCEYCSLHLAKCPNSYSQISHISYIETPLTPHIVWCGRHSHGRSEGERGTVIRVTVKWLHRDAAISQMHLLHALHCHRLSRKLFIVLPKLTKANNNTAHTKFQSSCKKAIPLFFSTFKLTG